MVEGAEFWFIGQKLFKGLNICDSTNLRLIGPNYWVFMFIALTTSVNEVSSWDLSQKVKGFHRATKLRLGCSTSKIHQRNKLGVLCRNKWDISEFRLRESKLRCGKCEFVDFKWLFLRIIWRKTLLWSVLTQLLIRNWGKLGLNRWVQGLDWHIRLFQHSELFALLRVLRLVAQLEPFTCFVLWT